MHNLATAYLYRIRGTRADNLEKAIAYSQAALQVRTQKDMPVDWATTMNNLTLAYQNRIRGTRADNLEKAIAYSQAALQVITHKDMPVDWAITMNNLALAYQNRIRGTRADNLEKAIKGYQAALQVITLENMRVKWATAMNNLALAYQNRIRGTRADNLEKAIKGYQAALQVRTQKDMPVEWAETMNNLALAYQNRICGTRADNLEKAIKGYQAALQVTTHEAMPHDHRLTQRNLGHLHFDENNWQAAHTAYQAALQTTETLYTLDEGSAEGLQAELAENQYLAARASYCLAKLGRFDEAVVTLEQGRTRAFSETYNATLLKMAHETEQQAYTEASEQVKILEKEMYTAGQENKRSRDEVLADLKSARTELATIVETIRQTIPDFMPKGFNFQSIYQLATSLKQPLVYLLTTSKGSLALIVPPNTTTLGEEQAVWLDNFTTEKLDGLLYDTDETQGYLRGTVLADFQVLKSLLTEKIRPLLSEQLITPLDQRLKQFGYLQAVLIPMDTLNLLPLHADTELAFSFAPSARLLQTALNKTQPYADAPLSLLGIGNPTAKGQNPLEYGPVEVAAIAALFPKQQQLCEHAATRAAVLAALDDKTHIHFSCHGLFDTKEPPNSALYLAGKDRFTVEDLILGTVDLAKTQMVVLSACQTGITDFKKTPNEVIGFSGAFMQAGVPAMISTLWPVDEIATMLLLLRFYENYLQENQPPAHALQQAQYWLRDATAETLIAYSRKITPYLPKNKKYLASNCKRLIRKNGAYEHPYYWAGFVFSGGGTSSSC
jgi:CHAT domain-containing protein/TPR repeat protein